MFKCSTIHVILYCLLGSLHSFNVHMRIMQYQFMYVHTFMETHKLAGITQYNPRLAIDRCAVI